MIPPILNNELRMLSHYTHVKGTQARKLSITVPLEERITSKSNPVFLKKKEDSVECLSNKLEALSISHRGQNPAPEMRNLIFEKTSDHIGILRINRPAVLNALNRDTLYELIFFLKNTLPKEGVKVLILTGVKGKGFVAGADIKEMQKMTSSQMRIFCELGQQATLALKQAPCVVIAAVDRFALGGGFELALACDIIIATLRAKFGLPEVKLGLIPGFGGTKLLSDAIGARLAKELVMTGRTLIAEKAKELGIVNHVCDEGYLEDECIAIANEIIANSFTAVCQAKQAIDEGYSKSFEEALKLERDAFTVCAERDESKQRMTDFLEKKHRE